MPHWMERFYLRGLLFFLPSLFVAGFSIFGIFPAVVHAQVPPAPISAPAQIANINQILSPASACAIINWIFWLIIVFSIIFTLSAAFKYLTAAGNPEQVHAAGVSLIYVAVAIVVALIAKGFPSIISGFIGGGLFGGVC